MSDNLLDLTRAVVFAPPGLSPREQKAVDLLLEEVEKRAGARWSRSTAWPEPDAAVVAVVAQRLMSTLGKRLRLEADTSLPEGYHLRTDGQQPAVYVIGNDERGVLFGIGHLLRRLHMAKGRITLAADSNISTAPAYRLRGHQIGYRDKVNSYDGWDLPQWEQYLRDLAVFGTNAVEMIPPRSDDLPTSVHFPRPPLDMMAGVSRLADAYGLDFWLWYPAMAEDYGDPAVVEFSLREWKEVLRSIPRLDGIFVPGGDPGAAPPQVLMALLERQAAQLREIHPNATWWVSPQGFTHEELGEFLAILRQEPPWLTGIVFGPWVHMTMAEFRALVPDRYPIRNYPDITHTLSCQHPVPDWDVAYALTIGREPVNPRPLDEAAIFHAEQPGTIGFLAYCEGCHDDLNKCLWSSLAWDPERPIIEILRDYGRYFIGDAYADDYAQLLLALERNWRGPLAANYGVYTTLQQFQAIEESANPWLLKNWRFLQGLYRAYYDAYVRSRLLYESSLEDQAMDKLRAAARSGSLLALNEAERILDRAVTYPVSQGWRTRVFQLAEALFQSPAHMQLSVHLYQGQEEVRGANLDGVDFPLNNSPWLKEQCAVIRQMADEQERCAAIRELVHWTDPGPGGFYDDLGSAVSQPHVVKKRTYAQDPQFIHTPQHRYPYRKSVRPLRLAWRGFTGSLNDAPWQMHYDHLDPTAQYRIRLVYSDLAPQVKVRLDAGGLEVHPLLLKPAERQPLEFDIPRAATASGELTLQWSREPGQGQSGVGADVSEVWLTKVKQSS